VISRDLKEKSNLSMVDWLMGLRACSGIYYSTPWHMLFGKLFWQAVPPADEWCDYTLWRRFRLLLLKA